MRYPHDRSARTGRRQRTSTTVIIAVAVLGLGFAACGSGDADDSANEGPGSGDRDPPATPNSRADDSDLDLPDRPETRDTSTTEPPSEEPPPGTEPPPATGAGDDVDACLDLDCQITVTEGMEIPADGAVGITLVSFPEVSPESVTIVATGPGIQLTCGGTPGASCTLNGIDIEVTDARDGTAVVSFSP